MSKNPDSLVGDSALAVSRLTKTNSLVLKLLPPSSSVLTAKPPEGRKVVACHSVFDLGLLFHSPSLRANGRSKENIQPSIPRGFKNGENGK